MHRTAQGVRVEVTDQARTGRSFDPEAPQPDIDQKLAGVQGPRGWGMFLARSMVDDLDERTTDGRHTVRLRLNLAEAGETPGGTGNG